MPNLGIGITTAPRPGQENYLQRTLTSARDAGFNEHIHIFAEPGAPAVKLPSVTRHENRKKLGCFPNFANAVAYMAKQEVDWVLLLQDDVIFRDDAAEQLHREIATRDPKRTGFLSLYTNKSMRPATADGHEEQWHRPNFRLGTPRKQGKGYWGALATCWSMQSLRKMQKHPRYANHTHHRKVDVVIGFTCIELQLDVATYVPSLADHIGQKSTIGRDKVGNQWGRYGKDFREKADGDQG